jgi:D-amino peptidase
VRKLLLSQRCKSKDFALLILLIWYPIKKVINLLFKKVTRIENSFHVFQIDGDKIARINVNHILIIADIEGSSGCREKKAAQFFNKEWYKACVEMTKDVNAVSKSLLDAGVLHVTIKDFHRTGYNIIAENLDPRVALISGYKNGPVPGFSTIPNVSAVMFLGMHAASGTKGFLAHTLTSRIAKLTINGKIWSEAELFSASLGPFGIRPIFFSGCDEACRQVQVAIPGLVVYPIDKIGSGYSFNAAHWRECLCQKAVTAIATSTAPPFLPEGPFYANVDFRDGEKTARLISRRWGFVCQGASVIIKADSFHDLYMDLIRICYLTPLIEKMLPGGLLAIYNLIGWAGLKFYGIKVGRK